MITAKTPRGQTNTTGALTKCSHKRKKLPSKPSQPAQKAGPFNQSRPEATMFRKFYDRSDLPVQVTNNVRGPKLKWKVELESLDYHHYLPLFFEGLRETTQPYAIIATQGADTMLEHLPPRTGIVSVVPQLILPIKQALETRNKPIMCRAIRAIQKLVECEEKVGEALVPYYRQILPIMNLYKGCNTNSGDGIVYGQGRDDNVGDLIDETLQMLEKTGGEDAFINIKYMVPTYESCVLN